jgi:hypothetical protein
MGDVLQLELEGDSQLPHSSSDARFMRRARSLSPSPRRPPSAGVVLAAYGATQPHRCVLNHAARVHGAQLVGAGHHTAVLA